MLSVFGGMIETVGVEGLGPLTALLENRILTRWRGTPGFAAFDDGTLRAIAWVMVGTVLDLADSVHRGDVAEARALAVVARVPAAVAATFEDPS